MRVIEVRPARIQARYVEVGDTFVSSPIGPDGARPSQWVGRVTELIEVDPEFSTGGYRPEDMRQWRIALVDGSFTESAPVPADGFVWVHLPSPSELAD